MRLLLTVVVAVSLLVSCSCGLPHHVRDGSFTTRSGQIALGFASDELFSVSASPSATLFFKSAAPLSSPLPPTLADYQLADFLAHSLGLSPLHLDDGRLDRSAYPRSAAFAKPAASLLAVFDGAAPAFARQYPAVHVTPSYLSQSALSTLETIFAGAAPSTHGVIADSWYCFETHSVVDALSPAGLPFAPSFFDLAAAAADPASLQLTVATDDQLAALLGAAASDDKPVDLAYLQMKLGACAGASLSVSGEQVRIALADSTAAVFDLTERRHAELLAQLSGVFHLIDELTCTDGPYAQLTRDAAPDMFVVGFASLDGLSADARAVAAALIDSAVEQATEQLSQLYNGRLLAAYLSTSADLPANMVDACSSLGHLDWVADVSVLPLAKTCPAVYLSPSLSAEQIGSLRAQLSEDLAPFGVAAFVLPQHYALLFRAANDTNGGNQTDDGATTYTGADVAMFQIILWTSIILFLTLVATLSGMFCLTWEGENSPVFIETNSIQKNNIDPSNI